MEGSADVWMKTVRMSQSEHGGSAQNGNGISIRHGMTPGCSPSAASHSSRYFSETDLGRFFFPFVKWGN